jgi:hypothetical protein
MAGKQAKILSNDQVERLLSLASTTRNPLRNRGPPVSDIVKDIPIMLMRLTPNAEPTR